MAKLYNLARVNTATTGTGTITLGTAVAGYLTFALAGVVDGDSVYYAVKDGSNSEIGIGTYTASGTTLTRTVINSTNSNSAISLSGTAEVFITPPATAFREVLTGARTYYVRTDGSDSNTGLVNSAGGAFLTIQKAVDTVSATLDLATYDVTIQVGAGTYTNAVVLKKTVGTGFVRLLGDTTTPANVILSPSSGTVITNSGVVSSSYSVKGFKFTNAGGGSCFDFGAPIYVEIGNLDIAPVSAVNAHITANGGAIIKIVSDYTVRTGGGYHLRASNGFGCIYGNGITITVASTPAFSNAFIEVVENSYVNFNATISGSATGKRYNAATGGIINANGGGANYFPGNVAGTVTTPGFYG